MRRYLLMGHFLPIGAYAPIFLYSQNQHRFPAEALVRPVVFVLMLLLLAWGAMSLLVRDCAKAAVFISVQTLFFFSYGYAFDALKQWHGERLLDFLGWHIVLWVFWLLSSAALLFLLLRMRRLPGRAHVFFHCLALVLLSLPILAIARFHLTERTWESTGKVDAFGENWINSLNARVPDELPDIYHIVLDAHTRLDVLRDVYGYDAGDLERFLEEEGFHIADKSYSNYNRTYPSLTSMLNFEYVQTLVPDLRENSIDWNLLNEHKGNPRIVRIFKELGYRYVVLQNGWEKEEGEYADTFIGPQHSLRGIYVNEFDNGVLAMTPIPFVFRRFSPGLMHFSAFDRERIVWSLQYMTKIHIEKGPKFVFAHLMSPHRPILFGPNGETIENFPDLEQLRMSDPEKAAEGVRGQTQYLHTHLRKIVGSLKEHSGGRAIILINSDHGEALAPYDDEINHVWQQNANLLALYLPPEMDRSQLEDEQSLVNTYRIILNAAFGTELPLLEDRIFYSSGNYRFRFRDYTDSLRAQGFF